MYLLATSCLVPLWDWFVVAQFGLPALTLWSALGLGILPETCLTL